MSPIAYFPFSLVYRPLAYFAPLLHCYWTGLDHTILFLDLQTNVRVVWFNLVVSSQSILYVLYHTCTETLVKFGPVVLEICVRT